MDAFSSISNRTQSLHDAIRGVAGCPHAVDLLQKASEEGYADGSPISTTELVRAAFPYALDDFQLSALDALTAGRNVVLSAPTGAGKTVVGEIAVYLALMRGLRVFYCTPLKALSNQKFSDFRQQFGEDRIGLLTGDVSINRDAQVVVMTTEVYRNMLYDVHDPDVERLFAVVLDEFHFLNQRDRGTVWEESVINSPEHVRLVALSATMANASEIRDWLTAVHAPTDLVETTNRPVPLRFGFCDSRGILPLFAENEIPENAQRGFERAQNGRRKKKTRQKLHPKLLRSVKESSAARVLERSARRARGKRRESVSGRLEKAMGDSRELDRLILAMRKDRPRDAPIPSYPFVVRSLRRREMLPCIVFIFSRAGCDAAARDAARERDSLVTPDEQAELRKRISAFAAQNVDLVHRERLQLAAMGIASHHAGLLPVWKVCVEELFRDGLIKVVFATETLAAGINMPARTTVISALAKRAGAEGIVQLTTSEVLQMAGRAGRRGKDTLGHSLIMPTRFEGVLNAFRVVTSDVDALTSRFTPTFGMVLNTLQMRTLASAKSLVDSSFGSFLRQKRVVTDATPPSSEEDDREQAAFEEVLTQCQVVVEAHDEALVRSYNRLVEKAKAEKSALYYLENQSRDRDVGDTLAFVPCGTRIVLREPVPETETKSEKRRKKRRAFKEAVAAARSGKGAEALCALFLDDGAEFDEDIHIAEPGVKYETREAVLIDMLGEEKEDMPFFMAIDDLGSFRLFNHTHVERVHYDDDDQLKFDELAPAWRVAAVPELDTWVDIGGDQFTSELPEGLESLRDRIVEWITSKHEQGNIVTTDDDADEIHDAVYAQQQRVEHVSSMIAEHELHADGIGARVLRAKQAKSHIELTLRSRFGKKHKGKKRKRRKKKVGEEEVIEDSSWGDFMAITELLQSYGFIDASHSVTAMGELGAKVRSENELWTSLVLLTPAIELLSPAHLGAALAATQIDGGPADAYVDNAPSDEVLAAAEALEQSRSRLLGAQMEHGIDVAVPLDVELVGIVEKWARGDSWADVLASTSLQEGDVCRIIRRNLDLLRQIAHLPLISNTLRRNARRSIALLDRFPVTDDVTYSVRPDEKLDGKEDELR